MKYLHLLLIVLLFTILCGCANTYNLTEAQQLEAIKKYPRGGLNIEPDDSAFITTMKITGRVIICPLTFGISEVLLHQDREETFQKYYYDSFLGKPCAVAILEFGAPAKITTDGKNGKIYVWEKIYTTGGYGDTPVVYHKNIKEFYYSSNDKCYLWRIKNE